MLRKFGPNDIIINTMRATPLAAFFIYDSKIYYNDEPARKFATMYNSTPGASPSVLQTDQLTSAPSTGYLSLYEYNIARTSGSYAPIAPGVSTPGELEGGGSWLPNSGIVPMIYPYLSKDSARASFKTATGGDTIEGMTPAFYNNEFQFGDVIKGQYPQNCTITREFIMEASSSGDPDAVNDIGEPAPTNGTYNRHFVSLKTLMDIYGVKSRHYVVSSSFANKNKQTGSLIHIPSLFYGTKIRPGTVSLKWYYTGSLMGELRDTKRNGELIQVSGSSANNGKIAGVIFYNEGFAYLTGSWDISNAACPAVSLSSSSDAAEGKKAPSWIYWGAGMNDGVTEASTSNTTKVGNIKTASFAMNFEGETKTQVMTLYAHARRGEVNYSSNPSFLEYGQRLMKMTSSHLYAENPNRRMKNTVSSAFGTGSISSNYTASFQRQVYISKIGVYDKERNLIAVATLGSPVLKKEDEDLAFKLKMDF